MPFPFFFRRDESTDPRQEIREHDTRFPSLQEGFNRRWVGSSMDSVYIVRTTNDAVAALNDAKSRYRPGEVRIMSGGHCYENFVFNENVKAVINMSGLLDYGHDPEKGYYLSSGDTNWDSFRKLFTDYGKVLPAGSCYSVALGGHISGGGDGMLSRKHGLTVDWLTGVEVVVKPGRLPAQLKYVSRDSWFQDERDLFWAHTGGGGGNFGIITKYYFKTLPNAPRGTVATNVYFDWDDLTEEILAEILAWYFQFAFEVKRYTTAKFPMFHQGAGQFTMYIYTSFTTDSELAEAKRNHYQWEQELNAIITIRPAKMPLGSHGGWMSFPLRERKTHATLEDYEAADEMVYPFYSAVQTMNGSGPNQRGKYKSAYMKRVLPEHQFETLWKWLTYTPDGLEPSDMTESLVQFDVFGGKIQDVPADHTAIAQRSYVIKMQYQTYWQYESDDNNHLDWINGFYDEMYAPYGNVPDPDTKVPSGFGRFEGCYYNYPDVGLNNWKNDRYGALYLYFLGNLPRLISTKKRWDPEDFFQHAQSIPVKTLKEALDSHGPIEPIE